MLDAEQLRAFEVAIEDILSLEEDGISEYELMRWLGREGHESYKQSFLQDNLALFRAHFILFHALYRLRDRLWEDASGFLEISAVKIIRHPYQATEDGLQPLDDLREYYLDIRNLTDTTETDVDDMLRSFWEKYLTADDRVEALKTLELQEPVGYAEIKERYRERALEHHPDRGGSEETIKEINHAMSVLERYYKP